MKKVIFLILILALVFTLAACRANIFDGKATPTPTAAPPVTGTAKPSPADGDMLGGNGNGGNVSGNNDLNANP